MFGLRWLLRRFDIPTNVYYNYLKNRKATYLKIKSKMMKHIKDLYEKHAGVLRYRQIAGTLRLQGIPLSDNTVYSYMKQMGIKAIIMCKKPDYVHGVKHRLYDNLINQEFKASAPNQKWCTDFTYLKLNDGRKRYNCSIIDLFDRSIVATLNGKSITSKLAINTIEIALGKSNKTEDLILHSDYAGKNTIRVQC